MSGPRFRGSFPLNELTYDGRLLVKVAAPKQPVGVMYRGENVGFVDEFDFNFTPGLVTVRGALLRKLGQSMTEFVHHDPLYLGPDITSDIGQTWDDEAMVMTISGTIGGFGLDDRPCWPGHRPIILGSAA